MSTRRLFVGNLNFRTTEQQLKSYFMDAGKVVSMRIPVDPTTGRSRGFGFVEFATEDEARMAIEVFDGRRLAGRIIDVRMATDSPQQRRKPPVVERSRAWESDEDHDGDDFEPRDHKHRREWREMRRSKRSL